MKRNHHAARSGVLLVFLLATMHADAQRWTQLAKPATGPTPDLYGAHFFTRDSGYVCGEAGGTGRLYFTADGGASWRDVTSRLPGAPGPLNDLHFLSDGTGALAGDNAYVAITIDGGATWRQASVTRAAWPNGGDIQSVHARSASEIFVAGKAAGSGNGPRIARTSDGGATWTGIPQTGSQNNLYAIDFFDAIHGVVVGTGVNARKSATTDGGITWEPDGHIGSDPTRSLSFYGVDAVAGTSIAYASGGNVVGSGRFAEVRKSTDNGLTWSATALGSSLPGNSKTANSVLALTDEIIYVSTQGFRIYRSIDGGASWSTENLPAGSSDLRTICATPTDELYVIGRSGNVLRASLFSHPLALSSAISLPSVCAGEATTASDTIMNAGIARLRIDSVTVEGPSIAGVTIAVAAYPPILAAHRSGAIVLRAEAGRDAPPGLHTALLRVRSNDSLYGGRDTLLAIPVTIEVRPRTIALAPAIVADAGYLAIGKRGALRLGGAIINAGSCPTAITRLRLAFGTDFELPDSTGPIVPPGGAADLVVNFIPSAPCLRIDTLLIDHDGVTGSPLRIVLSGTGLEQRFATEPADTLPMRATPVGVPMRETIRLVNRKIGGCLDTTFVLSLTIAGEDAADFALDVGIPSGGVLAIPPHDELPVPIVATPSAPGARHAMLIIAHTVPGSSPDTVMLFARGLKPELTGAIESVRFGLTEVGAGRDSIVEGMLVNLGDASSTIEAITIEGIDGTDFAVTAPPVPFDLPVSATASLSLRFTPTAAGERRALLHVQPRDADGITIRLGGRGAVPSLAVRDDSIGFSPVRIGACRDTVLDALLRNDGELPLKLQSMTIAPSPLGRAGDTAAFIIVAPTIPPDLSLAPGDSVRVALRFCSIAGRRHEAMLKIVGKMAGSPLAIRLVGEGFPGPGFALDSIIFPPVPLPASRDSVVERCIVNGSAVPMRVDSVVIAGSSFSLIGPLPPFTISPWDTGGLTLRFSPTNAGLNIGELALYHDGESLPLERIDLAGTGLALALAYDPPLGAGGLDFGTLRVGRSAEMTVTVTNVAGASLKLDEVGATTSFFTVTSSRPLPLLLGPGERLELRVRFQPGGTGPHIAMLRVRSGDLADSAIRLKGRGVMHALRAASDTVDLGTSSAGDIVDTEIVLLNEPTPAIPLPEDLDGVSIEGALIVPSTSGFSVGAIPGTIGPNGRDSIAVHLLAPGAPGIYRTMLLVAYDRHEKDGMIVADTLRVVLLARVERRNDTLFRAGASLGTGLIGSPGDIVHMPVILSPGIEGAEVDTILLRLAWRPTMLRPLGIAGRGGIFALPENDSPAGTLTTLLVADRVFLSGTIAEVTFEVLLGDSATTTIRIDSIAAVAHPDVLFSADPATFVIVGLCDGEEGLIRFDSALTLASKPNPAVRRLTIEYTLPALCDLRLGLFDASGIEAMSLAAGRRLPGSYATPLDVSTLPAGTYYCVLSAGRFSRTIIVRILK
jgi:photosystem II stability/assembly factor-like uncharacterized protein